MAKTAPLPLIVPDDALPAVRLGLQPLIQSPADIGRALEELHWIVSRQQTVLAAAEQSIALINSVAEKKLSLDVDDEVDGETVAQTVSFADRQAALEQAIADYVVANRPLVFEQYPDVKTATYTHGALKLAKPRPQVGFQDECSEKTVLAALGRKVDRKAGLLAKLTAVLRKVKVCGDHNVATFVRLKPSLDKPAILKLSTEKKIRPGELKRLGVKIEGGEGAQDELSIHVNASTVTSRKAEPAGDEE